MHKNMIGRAYVMRPHVLDLRKDACCNLIQMLVVQLVEMLHETTAALCEAGAELLLMPPVSLLLLDSTLRPKSVPVTL